MAACHEEAVGALIGLFLGDHLVEPFEREVGIDHSHRFTPTVVYGCAVGGYHRLCTVGVQIGLTPVPAVLGDGDGKKLTFRIVVRGRSQLYGLNGYSAVRRCPPHCIGLKPVSFLGIVVWNEGDGAAKDGRIVFHHAIRGDKHRVCFSELIADYPGHVVEGHLHLRQLVTDTVEDGVHLLIHQIFHRILDDGVVNIPHHTRGDLQQQGRSDDGRQSKVPLQDILQTLPEVLGF